jgi:hypothetical protein
MALIVGRNFDNLRGDSDLGRQRLRGFLGAAHLRSNDAGNACVTKRSHQILGALHASLGQARVVRWLVPDAFEALFRSDPGHLRCVGMSQASHGGGRAVLAALLAER